ncbi:hypothetical protein FZEAL_10597 [Fusarium zealandicum]|uniref:Bud22 domain-containing protein n=1 Tax=Fusarium zealandicum TaxID=1053134 RepID=A0A8H4TZE0_9HYPO|nr:hypothetical protein FZEAL_10597 [Fusarium zealandicum]
MPKRKRGEPSLADKLDKHCNDVSKALKAAKGFERQRLSKRLRDDGLEPDKKERLDREVMVLKSLDLHQTARAHMYSSILKHKTLAASPDLPEEIRTGVPKPELSPEEQAALHNVTSGLYNRDPVKKAIDSAVTTVCQALDVPLPGKGKRVRKSKREEQEEQPSDRIEETPKVEEKVIEEDVRESVEEEEDDGEESDFKGFSDADDAAQEPEDLDSDVAAEEEDAVSKYDHLLGGSDDEDEDDFDDERFERFKGKEKVNLDDISISGSDAEPELDSESDSEPETRQRRSISSSASPPPAKKKKDKTASVPARPTNSTFLPSLMGGYISGSESASDIDVAPPKKRRGQRARQLIWEKKFGTKAKHLKKPAQQGGRDSGWDMRRGAVEGGDDQQRTPWKKGIQNPLARQGGDARRPEVKRPPLHKDDEGPLHPSWEARKKAKDSAKTTSFAGSKITFD